MVEGSWVGQDVHARSVVAGVLDGGSGELQTLRVPVAGEETVAWLQSLPRPVRVAYEAGPTGYPLARACAAAGIACTLTAPSKIPRAPGDRVKTDRRDAERLARLLRLGELVAVRVPERHEEGRIQHPVTALDLHAVAAKASGSKRRSAAADVGISGRGARGSSSVHLTHSVGRALCQGNTF